MRVSSFIYNSGCGGQLSGEAASTDKESMKDIISPWLKKVIDGEGYPFILILMSLASTRSKCCQGCTF